MSRWRHAKLTVLLCFYSWLQLSCRIKYELQDFTQIFLIKDYKILSASINFLLPPSRLNILYVNDQEIYLSTITITCILDWAMNICYEFSEKMHTFQELNNIATWIVHQSL